MGFSGMRGGAILVAVIGLTGCQSAMLGVDAPQAPERELALLGGDVVATGPSEFCVDSSASRPRAGLALIAACSTLAGEGRVPWRNAVIVVQAGDEGSASVSGSEKAMAALLDGASGAAVLGQNADTDQIEVIETRSSAGLVTVVYTDKGTFPVPGAQQAEWRTFLDINDRLVSISLRGLADDPLSEAAGNSLLRDAVAALRAANVS